MTTLFFLLVGAALFILALGVFLWAAGRRFSPRAAGRETVSLFREEVAEEIGLFPPASPEVPSLPPREPELALPRRYGVDRLVLMVRDPYWLYAYWEISATRQEEFNSVYGPRAWESTRPVLRVYDVTGVDFNGSNAVGYTDISIQEEADSWHIHVGQPNRSYCVDLGRKFPDGRFVTLLRSNVVTTPRSSLSECLDEEWMWIEELYRGLYFPYGVSSPMIAAEMRARVEAFPVGIGSPAFGPPAQSPPPQNP